MPNSWSVHAFPQIFLRPWGSNAAFGRTLEPEDDRPGSPNVVVMAYALWQRRFGGDASLIGKSLDLNGASYTLVGILPQNFIFPIPDAELAVPLVPDADPWRLNRDSVNFLRLVGRTRPGTKSERAQAEMNALARKLREQFPESNARKLGVKLTPIRDQITGGYRRALWVLLGAVGFVLLIACANLANLNLVRASARQREMSIRSALGATRPQVVKQLLLESCLAGGRRGPRGCIPGALWCTSAGCPESFEHPASGRDRAGRLGTGFHRSNLAGGRDSHWVGACAVDLAR